MKKAKKLNSLKEKINNFRPSKENFLAYGQQHKIFKLDDEHVIKVPRKLSIAPVISSEESGKDVAFIEKYFNDYYLKTFVFPHGSFNYVVVQEQVNKVKNLRLSRISDDRLIRKQFLNIIKSNEILIQKYNISLDFFGHHGLMATVKGLLTFNKNLFQLSNILEGPNGRIYIVDTNLTFVGSIRLNQSGLRRAIVDKFSFWLNNKLLKFCLKI